MCFHVPEVLGRTKRLSGGPKIPQDGTQEVPRSPQDAEYMCFYVFSFPRMPKSCVFQVFAISRMCFYVFFVSQDPKMLCFSRVCYIADAFLHNSNHFVIEIVSN